MTSETCPVCNLDSPKESFTYRFTPKTNQYERYVEFLRTDSVVQRQPEPYLICSNCGFVFRVEIQSQSSGTPVSKEPDDARLEIDFAKHADERNQKKILNRYGWIQQNTCTGKLLDIGCEYGFMVKHFADLGFDASGIDPYEPALKIARQKFGLEFMSGFYEKRSYPEQTFDIISAEGVSYYYRPNFKVFMDLVGFHLKEEGYAYLRLPDGENTGPEYAPNFIRCLVPYDNCEAIFNRLGWKIISKNHDFFGPGYYGVIVQKTGQSLKGAPLLSVARQHRNLVISDYNFLRTNYVKKPLVLEQILLLFHYIDPTGYAAAYWAKLVNRAYRVIYGAKIF